MNAVGHSGKHSDSSYSCQRPNDRHGPNGERGDGGLIQDRIGIQRTRWVKRGEMVDRIEHSMFLFDDAIVSQS